MSFNYYYVVIMWVMVAVLTVADFKQLKRVKEMEAKYDLNNYQVWDYSKKQKNMLKIFAVLIVVIALSSFVSTKSFEITTILINIAFVVMVTFEYYTSSKCMKFYYDDKNIIYEGDIIRLKSIKSVTKEGKGSKNHSMVTFDGHSYAITEDCAKVINQQISLMKEEKKEKKKK